MGKESYGVEARKKDYGMEIQKKESYGAEARKKESYGIEARKKESYGVEARKKNYGMETRRKEDDGVAAKRNEGYGMGTHGGDIYRNQVKADFSVNINPLGVPKSVEEALHRAVGLCSRYPDIKAEKLKQAVGRMLGVPEEYLLFGNGASELLMAAAHGLKAGKAWIPVPSFYGYEYAAKAAGCEAVYYGMGQDSNFCLPKDVGSALPKDVGVVFLANPNNPTGNLLGKEDVKSFLQQCKDRGITVVLDECFIEFCGSQYSMLPEAREFGNLIIIRAFTKIFSIPGVRLGYFICKDPSLRAKIACQLPEWNVSCFAQEAGCACAGQAAFIQETEKYIRKERKFLEEGLRRKGFLVFPSQANFILFYSKEPLYGKLLEQGILIRDCRNFRGLGPGYYRVAVKSREENEVLLEHL